MPIKHGDFPCFFCMLRVPLGDSSLCKALPLLVILLAWWIWISMAGDDSSLQMVALPPENCFGIGLRGIASPQKNGKI